MKDIKQQAEENVGTAPEVPDEVYEDAVLDEAKKIVSDRVSSVHARQMSTLADLTRSSMEDSNECV